MASGAVPGRGARGGGGAGGGGPAMAVSPYVQAMQELFRANTRSREFPAHGAKVHSVAWSCCGRRLASGSFDKTASVFLLEKDRLVRDIRRHRAGGGGAGRYREPLGSPGAAAWAGVRKRESVPVVGAGPRVAVRTETGASPGAAQARSAGREWSWWCPFSILAGRERERGWGGF